ncbi:hypothetical protein BH11PLA2_BH11PLA2_28630 [soil metagenome]
MRSTPARLVAAVTRPLQHGLRYAGFVWGGVQRSAQDRTAVQQVAPDVTRPGRDRRSAAHPRVPGDHARRAAFERHGSTAIAPGSETGAAQPAENHNRGPARFRSCRLRVLRGLPERVYSPVRMVVRNDARPVGVTGRSGKWGLLIKQVSAARPEVRRGRTIPVRVQGDEARPISLPFEPRKPLARIHRLRRLLKPVL